MNKILCNSGRNFLIIDNYSNYYRCYSGYSLSLENNNSFVLGNILKDKEINILNNLECEYNVECNYGCREGCDYGETIRFDPTTLKSTDIGKCYRLTHIDNINNIKNELDFYWHITNYCNMQCIYCNYPCIRNNKFELSKDNILFIFNTLLEKFNYLYINLTGGEPSIHPGFIDLCKKIYDNNNKCYLRILTNLSNFNVLKKIMDFKWPENKLEFWTSCHFSEPSFNLNNFMKLCQICVEKKYKISVSTVNHSNEARYYNEYLDFFKKIGVSNVFHQFYEPIRSRSNDKDENFIPKSLYELRELSKKVCFSIPKLNKLNLENVTCTAGLDYFIVNPDGELKRCFNKNLTFIKKVNLFKKIEEQKENNDFEKKYYLEDIDNINFNKINPECNKMTCSRSCEGYKVNVWKNNNEIFNDVYWRSSVKYLKDVNKNNVFIEMDILVGCLSACPYCMVKNFYNVKSYKNLKYLNKEKICSFLEKISKIKKGYKRLLLCGSGDPMLHPNIHEIVEYATNLDFFVEIFTSGFYNFTILQKFKKKQNILLKISLHPNSRLWNLKKMESKIEILKKENFKEIECIFVKHEINMKYYNILKNICDENKINMICLLPIL